MTHNKLIKDAARALWEEWGQYEIRVCEQMMPEIAAAALAPTLALLGRRTTERDNAVANLKSAVNWLIELGVDPECFGAVLTLQEPT